MFYSTEDGFVPLFISLTVAAMYALHGLVLHALRLIFAPRYTASRHFRNGLQCLTARFAQAFWQYVQISATSLSKASRLARCSAVCSFLARGDSLIIFFRFCGSCCFRALALAVSAAPYWLGMACREGSNGRTRSLKNGAGNPPSH